MATRLLKDDVNVYRCGDCVVTPYPTTKILAIAYLEMEKEGILDTVFHEVPIDIEYFIGEYKKNKVILACFVQTKNTGDAAKDLEFAGLAWFNATWKLGDSGMNKAEVGIFFFKRFQKRRWTLTLSAMCAEWVFDHLPVYALFGTTPEPNKAACYFFRALGFDSVGPLRDYTTYPGVKGPVAVYISHMNKDDWQSVKLRWFSP